MTIPTGAHLNHYEIVTLLGVGGMGEVYKANDTRLGRPVALKILPAHLVEDADRVRRFIQEAKSASALNHPHIITIYEIGEAEVKESAPSGDSKRIHYIAMEFVDGSTLHTKIHRDRTDLKKLLEYFAQAGEGLAKAHAAGIVHRDLKPENLMITDDGYAKILDFGLAKLIESNEPSGDELEEAATAMMNQTRPGMVMGTVGYMSPEQAQGKPLDQRSDIFSFGCILFEATTGRKPFAGDSVIDSLHKIVYMQAPPIRESNPNAPAELQRIVRKCLAKDPGERYQSIRDVAIDLRDLIREYDSQQPSSMSFPPASPSGTYSQAPSTGPHSQTHSTDSHSQFAPTMMHPQPSSTGSQAPLSSGPVTGAILEPQRKSNRSLLVLAGLLGLAILAAAIYFLVLRKESGGRVGTPFQTTRITKLTSSGKSSGAVISPDGKYVAHFVSETGQPGIWVRQVATSSNVQIVPPADVGYVGLTFSRDGNYVYYVRGGRGQSLRTLYQVPVLGGPAKQVIEDVDSTITFSPDGKQFAFVRGYPREGEMALMVANADGTGEQRLAVKKQPDAFLQPEWSPDGKVIVCSLRSLTGGFHIELVEVQVAGGAERTITQQKWLAMGGMAWLSDGSGMIISALEEKPTSGQLQIWEVSYPSGAARRITNDLNNYAGVSLSSDSNAMVTVQSEANSNLWLAPNGDATRARQITSGSNSHDNSVSWTPDGKIVYVTNANGPPDVWIMDSDGKNQKQLTSDAGVNIFPNVSPDGRYIIFDSSRNSGSLNTFYIWRINIDGSNPKQLTQVGNEFFPVCSPDGKWVLYTPLNDWGKPNVWRVSIDGGDPVRLTDYVSIRPVISPDGKFIACQYREEQPGSLIKIAIVPFEGGPPQKVLNIQAGQYQWSRDGKAIIYPDTKGGITNLWSQPVDGGAARQLTNFTSDQIFTFDWSRDGKRLVCARGVQTTDVVLIKDLRQNEGKE
jgi:eukaryotic-like serine/threonine-protein kinase